MRGAILAMAAAMAMAAPAHAQAPQLVEQWTRCVNTASTYEVEVAVTACTAIIGAQIETRENIAIAHYNRGKEHARGRAWAAAIADYSQAIELGYREAGAFYARAVARHESGDIQGAIADFNETLGLDANNLDALAGRADAYQYGLRDYDHAIADYDALLARRETAADFIRRGNAYQYGKNDAERAMADYERAVQLDANAPVYLDRGNVLYARGEYAAAKAQYDLAIERDANNADARFNRGNARWALNEIDGAIEDWSATLSLRGDYADALGNRAAAYRLKHRYDLALSDLDRALGIRVNADDLHTRGLVYQEGLRDDIRAIADFDQAIALAPENPAFRNSACWARAVAERDMELARTHCDAAIAADPNADFLDSRGLLNLRQNRNQEAWNDFDAAVRADANHVHALYGRGLAALRLGRTAEGRADLAAASARDRTIARTWEEYGFIP